MKLGREISIQAADPLTCNANPEISPTTTPPFIPVTKPRAGKLLKRSQYPSTLENQGETRQKTLYIFAQRAFIVFKVSHD
ncbi:MAG TPA: hypothetical protein VE956_08190 [Nodularia sp. (in: cyanobacteria)]|nr:hypothetical protein [Nodularia sp. (in: cyanobacteria)]